MVFVSILVGKMRFCDFDTPSAVELLLLPLWATELELLGLKIPAQVAQSRPGQASQRGQASQVSSFLVGVMETAGNRRKPLGTSPELSQVGGQSLSS